MFQIKSSILLQTSFALIFFLSISSCGLQPIYAKKGANSNLCNNFTVSSKNYKEVGNKIKYKIQDRLNQACIDEKTNYKVELELDKGQEEVSIQKDREVTRYNVTLHVKYKIFVEGNKKLFAEGSKSLVGGYDAVASDYGTYSNEQDTFEKLSSEMAEDLSLKILAIARKKSQNNG